MSEEELLLTLYDALNTAPLKQLFGDGHGGGLGLWGQFTEFSSKLGQVQIAGTTSFHSFDWSGEVSAKRYQHIGKEREGGTGLYQGAGRAVSVRLAQLGAAAGWGRRSLRT